MPISSLMKNSIPVLIVIFLVAQIYFCGSVSATPKPICEPLAYIRAVTLERQALTKFDRAVRFDQWTHWLMKNVSGQTREAVRIRGQIRMLKTYKWIEAENVGAIRTEWENTFLIVESHYSRIQKNIKRISDLKKSSDPQVKPLLESLEKENLRLGKKFAYYFFDWKWAKNYFDDLLASRAVDDPFRQELKSLVDTMGAKDPRAKSAIDALNAKRAELDANFIKSVLAESPPPSMMELKGVSILTYLQDLAPAVESRYRLKTPSIDAVQKYVFSEPEINLYLARIRFRVETLSMVRGLLSRSENVYQLSRFLSKTQKIPYLRKVNVQKILKYLYDDYDRRQFVSPILDVLQSKANDEAKYTAIRELSELENNRGLVAFFRLSEARGMAEKFVTAMERLAETDDFTKAFVDAKMKPARELALSLGDLSLSNAPPFAFVATPIAVGSSIAYLSHLIFGEDENESTVALEDLGEVTGDALVEEVVSGATKIE
jgi:hypothetical protein